MSDSEKVEHKADNLLKDGRLQEQLEKEGKSEAEAPPKHEEMPKKMEENEKKEETSEEQSKQGKPGDEEIKINEEKKVEKSLEEEKEHSHKDKKKVETPKEERIAKQEQKIETKKESKKELEANVEKENEKKIEKPKEEKHAVKPKSEEIVKTDSAKEEKTENHKEDTHPKIQDKKEHPEAKIESYGDEKDVKLEKNQIQDKKVDPIKKNKRPEINKQKDIKDEDKTPQLEKNSEQKMLAKKVEPKKVEEKPEREEKIEPQNNDPMFPKIEDKPHAYESQFQETPQRAYQEAAQSAYGTNPEHMNTMPAAKGYKLNDSPNFKPRRTFNGRSTDREYNMNNYAKLSAKWDDRFYVCPSINNFRSHTYYKQFFDKPTRSKQSVVLRPRKRLDPFLENENKTRIPKYSKVYEERDITREFSWVNNFAVMHSKNNARIHKTYKEYFDKPIG
jgi:hypothetical protein